MPKAKKILAWHFTDGMTLRDGQPLVVGKTYRHNEKVELCESGYHASRILFDALRYAPGTQLSRVECWGDVKEDGDKLVARNRRVLWTIDATMILHEFACRVAEIALSKIKDADPRSFAAIEAKRKWMRGEITDDQLNAAWSAARSAAWSATRSATWSAAWSAARSATRSAAWSAAESATRSDFNVQLEAMVNEAHDVQEAKE